MGQNKCCAGLISRQCWLEMSPACFFFFTKEKETKITETYSLYSSSRPTAIKVWAKFGVGFQCKVSRTLSCNSTLGRYVWCYAMVVSCSTSRMEAKRWPACQDVPFKSTRSGDWDPVKLDKLIAIVLKKRRLHKRHMWNVNQYAEVCQTGVSPHLRN